MTTLYGIPHCSTVKKARNWLESHQINYQFHDFRKQGLRKEKLQQWFTQCEWTRLLNKRSTSWKQLTDEQKQTLDKDMAFQLMLENPTLIKRPVLEYKTHTDVGFKELDWKHIFAID